MTIAPARVPETATTTTRGRPPDSIASRIGMWSAAHWKTATVGWLILVALAFVAGNMLGTTTIDPVSAIPGESGRACADRRGRLRPAGSANPCSSRARAANLDDAAFKAAVADVTTGLAASGDVQNLALTPDRPGTGLGLGRPAISTRPPSTCAVRRRTRPRRSPPIVASVDAVQSRHRGNCTSASSGPPAHGKPSTGPSAPISSRRAILSIPITLGILIVAFGALIAAGIPVLLALSPVGRARAPRPLPHTWSRRPTPPRRPAHRHGRRRRLLAVLSASREREERARAAAPRRRRDRRGRDLRHVRGRLRPRRDGRDGRAVPRR